MESEMGLAEGRDEDQSSLENMKCEVLFFDMTFATCVLILELRWQGER